MLEQLSALGQYPRSEKDLGWDAYQRTKLAEHQYRQQKARMQERAEEEAEAAAEAQKEAEAAAEAQKEAERRRRLHRMRNPELALAEGRKRKSARELAMQEEEEAARLAALIAAEGGLVTPGGLTKGALDKYKKASK
jgi:membrane protein involved in colicin uptake